MTIHTLFEILDGWTRNWDRTDIDITLHHIENSFNNQKTRFLLIDRIYAAIGYVDDVYDYITEGISKAQFESILQDEQFVQVAKFVQIESLEPPEFKISVLNIKETVAKFPNWFDEFKGISWDEFVSRLVD